MKYRFNLDPWQKDFLATKGDKVLCTGRQVGKSKICAIDAAIYAAANKNKVILMIAPTERQAFALFEETLDFLVLNFPKLISKGKKRPTKSKISLENGTIIWCLPTGLSGMGIRFLTVNRLYADEASRITEDVWVAVTPMLMTTGGDMILLSTPFGDDNFFWHAVANKDNAFKSFTRFSKDSETVVKERKVCKTWTIKQRDKALEKIYMDKARYSELRFAQEYLGKPLSALMQVFPDKLIQKCMVLEREPHTKGNYYLGVDIARMGDDESTFQIINRKGNKELLQVESITTKKTLTTQTTRKILDLHKQYNFKQIFVDDGGMGVGVFDQLLDNNLTKSRTVAINSTDRPLTRDEKKKKRVLKEDLYNNLIMLMERNEIKLLRDDKIFQSLKSVQFEINDNRVRYYGNNTHIAEGLIRAAWCVKDKRLNIWIY